MSVLGEILLVEQSSPSTAAIVSAAGAISSGQAFGTTRVLFVSRPVGPASAQAFGTTSVPRLLQRAGATTSAEAFGTAHILAVVGAGGIATREAFGTPTLPSTTILTPSGYGSVALDDVAAFPTVAIIDAAAFTAGSDTSSAYQQTIDEELVYDDNISSALVFAGAVDDTPGG